MDTCKALLTPFCTAKLASRRGSVSATEPRALTALARVVATCLVLSAAPMSQVSKPLRPVPKGPCCIRAADSLAASPAHPSLGSRCLLSDFDTRLVWSNASSCSCLGRSQHFAEDGDLISYDDTGSGRWPVFAGWPEL